jgi:DNA-binding GntR family transcriptional regulator
VAQRIGLDHPRWAGDERGLPASAHVVVRDQLQLAILSGEFPAGTRLHQSELAKSLGVSITPVREALRELASGGLVDFTAYAGAVVHTPSEDELEIISDMRAALLPVVVRHAIARVSDEDLNRAEHVTSEIDRCRSEARWVELNRSFHGILDSACGNTHLANVMAQTSDLLRLYVKIDLGNAPDHRNDEHHAMLSAYRARDVDQAIALNQAHLYSTVVGATSALHRGSPGRTTLSYPI